MTVKIAIDGPSGAGKSSIAKEIAKELGYIYIDTGAIYRAAGLYVMRQGVSSKSKSKICNLLPRINISLKHNDGMQRVFLNGDDVTDDIRTPDASAYASDVSAIPEVRKALFSLQRKIAESHNVVMDGRDIGTVVLPDADLKIFLTASPYERAKRRFIELKSRGVETSFNKVLKDMGQRDKNDKGREIAPLKPANDAIVVDTTNLGYNSALNKIMHIIREKLSNVI